LFERFRRTFGSLAIELSDRDLGRRSAGPSLAER
jgi:hypothetical protein